MASLTQQPLLSPLPNPEPPSFPILRDILSRKLISQEASPYGFSGGPAQEQSLYTGGGRGMFNPYSGGYGGAGGGGGQQMPPQGPPPMGGGGGGMFGFQPPQQGPPQMGGGQRGDVFALLQQLLSQGQQGPQPRAVMGRDGYTLNNQISHEGNFDGCSVGQDAMAPGLPGQGMMPPPRDPRHSAALRAIMGALMAKRHGQRRPMGPPRPEPIGMDASTPRMGDPRNGSMDVYNIESQWGGVPRGTGQLPIGATAQPAPPSGTPPTLASLGDPRNNTFLNQNPGSHGAFGSTPQNWDTNSVENWFSRGQGGGQQSTPVPEGTGNRGTPVPVGRDSMSQPWMAGPRPLGGIPMGGDMKQMPPMGNTHHRIGMDSPYHDQRGPMSPLGMDAPGPGMPGPYASNFGPGGTMGDAPPSPAISAIIQLLGGGGGGQMGDGGPMMRRRPQPVTPW